MWSNIWRLSNLTFSALKKLSQIDAMFLKDTFQPKFKLRSGVT